MPDYVIQDWAVRLGVWDAGQADDPVNTKRRIRKLREDAAD
jgi:hypothetical protein